MQLTVHEDQTGESVVDLVGALDRNTVPEVRERLLKLVRSAGRKNLVLDFSGVAAIDTAGIAMLVELRSSLMLNGGRLLLKGLTDNATRMIRLARLSGVLCGEESL